MQKVNPLPAEPPRKREVRNICGAAVGTWRHVSVMPVIAIKQMRDLLRRMDLRTEDDEPVLGGCAAERAEQIDTVAILAIARM